MAQMSTGGFIVLPGGYGTFEEMMEMITWNQLGIHRLPIVILNSERLPIPSRSLLMIVGGFYDHADALFKTAVEAGFIAPQNLALCRVVDLPGGKDANKDESRAGEWGDVAVQALRDWSFSVRSQPQPQE